MPEKNVEPEKSATESGQTAASIPISRRVLNFAGWIWRPAATVVVVALALLLGWHVVNGRNGLSVWHEKRAEDRMLKKEIDSLSEENTHLRDHVERLKSSPDAIGIVAREQLHYAKPNEVIVALPDDQPQATPSASGK